MKKIWLSSLEHDEKRVKELISQLKTYGLEARGHFWEMEPEKFSWMAVREELVKPEIAMWVIVGSEETLKNEDVRYGLCLLAIMLQAARGIGFPVVVLQTAGTPVSSEDLPTPLKGGDVLSAAGGAFGAKLVAKVHGGGKKDVSVDYRMDLYGSEQIGQWFEVGPTEAVWPGGMFAVEGADISFHGVGPKGSLPSKAVLNYPIEGLKLKLGGRDYTAWAVQNELGAETSYFVKVKGFPSSVLFGPYSEEESAEVYVLELK